MEPHQLCGATAWSTATAATWIIIGDDLGVPIHLEIFILIHFLNM